MSSSCILVLIPRKLPHLWVAIWMLSQPTLKNGNEIHSSWREVRRIVRSMSASLISTMQSWQLNQSIKPTNTQQINNFNTSWGWSGQDLWSWSDWLLGACIVVHHLLQGIGNCQTFIGNHYCCCLYCQWRIQCNRGEPLLFGCWVWLFRLHFVELLNDCINHSFVHMFKGIGIDELEKQGELRFLKDGPLYWVDSANFGPTLGTGGMCAWELTVNGKKFHSGFPHKGWKYAAEWSRNDMLAW